MVIYMFNLNTDVLDFPSGTLYKNLPANTGSMNSIPGPGRFHMLQSN